MLLGLSFIMTAGVVSSSYTTPFRAWASPPRARPVALFGMSIDQQPSSPRIVTASLSASVPLAPKPPAQRRVLDYLMTPARVTLLGAVLNVLLSGFKLIVGGLAGQASLIADGYHSLSDLMSDALCWFAVRMGQRPPDESHPYGDRCGEPNP